MAPIYRMITISNDEMITAKLKKTVEKCKKRPASCASAPLNIMPVCGKSEGVVPESKELVSKISECKMPESKESASRKSEGEMPISKAPVSKVSASKMFIGKAPANQTFASEMPVSEARVHKAPASKALARAILASALNVAAVLPVATLCVSAACDTSSFEENVPVACVFKYAISSEQAMSEDFAFEKTMPEALPLKGAVPENSTFEQIASEKLPSVQTVFEYAISEQTISKRQLTSAKTISDQTLYDQTEFEQTISKQTSSAQLTPEKAITEQPTAEQPTFEQTTAEQPTAEQTAAELPTPDSQLISEKELWDVANGIISWKKAANGSSEDGYLINESFLEQAGTTAGDWYPIGLSRLSYDDDLSSYLAVIKDIVKERYSDPGKLSPVKATEWHRIALAVLAAGGDPTNMGIDNGCVIDLIADGTYDRGKTTSLGRQGINGWIWGLIALDSMRYDVPENAYYTRDDIIIEILRRQLEDGGFALSGSTADPDITAMALQALSPYYNDEKTYTYTIASSGKTVTKAVYQIVDEALDCLSALQLEDGGFASWGTKNVESADQVIVALCCLNIDPFADSRFIKNGNTIYDSILTYRMADGGFVHSYTYDPDNPTSLPDASNSMAGEQTLYTMAALIRRSKGMRALYDFRKEQSAELKARISSLDEKIKSALELQNAIEKSTIEALLSEFYSIPYSERCYVTEYRSLSDAAKALCIDISKIAGETDVIESPRGDDNEQVLLYFSITDKQTVDSMPTELSTEWYVTVTALLDKLDRCEDFDEKELYIKKLEEAKEKISLIQEEIDLLNQDIKEKLYPFDRISISDKKTVDDIVSRYMALCDYDKAKIERYEDVIKTKTKIDNRIRGIVIAILLLTIALALTIILVLRIRKRRRKKLLEMEELAALYKDEE